MSKYRIMIIEDADRMTQNASNVLLKALEEPPPGTIWMLCAPSEADMLPTIRSRVRRVGLKVPSVADVAKLLVERDGVEPALAAKAAAEAQSHIGMARRLATSSDARNRRRDVLKAAMAITTVTQAVKTSERWLELAQKDAESLTAERDEVEKAELMASMGIGPKDTVPPALRAELKRLTDAQKRRATRSLRDGLDRVFVDLMALYRDVLSAQLASGATLINEDLAAEISDVARRTKPEDSLAKLEAIELARTRIGRNGSNSIVLDSLGVSLQLPRQ
jgi:DNA polymerase-3 subunit delta'